MRPMIDETSAVNDAPTLPYNLVEEEILSRLPVKSLLQLRCVCKSWNSLISIDPRFAKKHFSIMSTTPTRRLHFIRHFVPPSYHRTGTIASCPLQSIITTSCNSKKTKKQKNKNKITLSINVKEHEYPSYRSAYPPHVFVGSCNGILCLAHQYPLDDSFLVLLWNPSLGKVNELPQSRYPNLSGVSCGFGYDFVTNNYKVVAVLYYKGLQKPVVIINTLGTNFWKNLQDFPFNSIIDSSVSGKFVSGTINWLASKCWRKSPCFIVSLHLGTESYQKFMLPNYGKIDVFFLRLCVLRDSLCLISGRDLWIMKEYGNKESWIKLFRVSYMGDPFSKYMFNAVYMFEDGQVLFESSEDGCFKMFLYDPRIDTFKYIEFQDKSARDFDNYPIVCIESLISPYF